MEFIVPVSAPLHLAVALDGAGWHPAAWREADAEPQRLFTAAYWTELAQAGGARAEAPVEGVLVAHHQDR